MSSIFTYLASGMPEFNFDGSAIGWFIYILMIVGGLGLFLYGIELMGDSLKEMAGDKLKVVIEKTTNTPIKGILIGCLVTMIIQSSSGTTALTVSLVRAGLLTFPQAVGIIMGANIGTTITPFISALKIEEYSLLFVGVGALMIFFVKKPKIKKLGDILLGFGTLFLGLYFMGGALKNVFGHFDKQVGIVFNWLENWPFFGLIIGAVVTAAIQSSSATLVIVQSLEMPIKGALPILLGCNIGTTITAVFASFGGGVEAKRTAFVHALFNIVGATIFFILIIAGPDGNGPYVMLMDLFEPMGSKMQFAFAHIIFNVVTTFILYFFINKMVQLACYIFKDTTDERTKIPEELLDYSLINKSSVLALSFVKRAIDYMTECVIEYVNIARDYSFEQNEAQALRGAELEKTINCLDKRIHDYLIKLTISDLSSETSKLLSKYLDQIKDLERVGDHCTNIIEFFDERYEKDMYLSEDGKQDLEQIYSVLTQMSSETLEAVATWSSDKATAAMPHEDEIDKLEEIFHERHVHRVNSGSCSVLNAEHYVEILSNIERMGDHLKNILDSIASEEYCKYDEFNH